ncbi:MAG: hypothetical protein J6Y29_01645 [Clostridiales bacterium]|nr:hypothetical protein [Clostridiales bacterium]
MSLMSDKVSYVKGLADGLKIDDSTNEGKILLQILNILNDVACALEDDRNAIEELEDQIEGIDEDLGDLEEFVYSNNRDDYDSCDCDCGCSDDDDVKYITVECPHCKEETSFDVDIFGEDTNFVECPNCHQKIDVIYEDENDNCGCHCDK